MSVKIKFGGFGGWNEPFGGVVGGKQLIIRSGVVVDSIRIGTDSAGGGGGSEVVNAALPLDGIITLYTVSNSKTTKNNGYIFCSLRSVLMSSKIAPLWAS